MGPRAEALQLDVDRLDDFEARFQAARHRLLAICAPMVGSDEAHDVVQDTYIAARARLGRLRDPNALEAWLVRIAVNRCMDRHRRSGRLVPLSVVEDSRATTDPDRELRSLVERLPTRERTIVVLHYGHGYRLDEIGALLSLSHTNVRTIVSRARQRLLRSLREDQP